ncbi:hypothetical protein D3C72_2121330 [compost metagenome]
MMLDRLSCIFLMKFVITSKASLRLPVMLCSRIISICWVLPSASTWVLAEAMSSLLVSTVAAFCLILASSSATLPPIWSTQPCTTLPLASMVPLPSTSRGASAPVGTVSPDAFI